MFFRKKERIASIAYDPKLRVPAMRCSICTGERVAGFKNLQTGKFEDYQLIQNEDELQAFKQACGVSDLLIIY